MNHPAGKILLAFAVLAGMTASRAPAQSVNLTNVVSFISHSYDWDGPASWPLETPPYVSGEPVLVDAAESGYGEFTLTGTTNVSVTWSAPPGEMFVVNPPPSALGPLNLHLGAGFMLYNFYGETYFCNVNSFSASFNMVYGAAPGGGAVFYGGASDLDFSIQAVIATNGGSFAFTSATVTAQLSVSTNEYVVEAGSNYDPYAIVLYGGLPFTDPTDPGPLLTLQPLPTTSSADSGPGSLRQVIANAANGAVITFAPALSGRTITLASTLMLTNNLTIDASALPGGLQINGSNAVEVFSVAANHTVVLNSLTITNGQGGIGGGIHNVGTLTLNQCTLAGNSAGANGGGIGNGGNGTLTLNQCTLAGNSARANGGGIYITGESATLTLNQCTLAGNTADANGGGLYASSSLNLINSIVAGNTVGANESDVDDVDSGASPFFGGMNIIPSFADNYFTPPGNIITSAPLLAPLGNYGGPTQTMPPLPGSPAIGAGVAGIPGYPFPSTDQRGYPRTQNGLTDLGAVELPTIQFTANPTNAAVGATVQFTGPGEDSDGTAITQWNWSFGDGTTDTSQNPAHVFTTGGTFTPSLMVTNSLGLTLAAPGPALTTLLPPTIAGFSLAKTNLVINGSNGVSGLTYYVLTTTNLSLFRSQWTSVATNVLSASGNFALTVTNALNRSVPKQFYLLQVQ